MKKELYGETYINNKKLSAEGIEYKIKLKYYKIENKKDNTCGIEIQKIEYSKPTKNIEKNLIQIDSTENNIDHTIEMLKTYQVTPIALEDVIYDLQNG